MAQRCLRHIDGVAYRRGYSDTDRERGRRERGRRRSREQERTRAREEPSARDSHTGRDTNECRASKGTKQDACGRLRRRRRRGFVKKIGLAVSEFAA